MKDKNRKDVEIPIYGASEASLYLRIPKRTLDYWLLEKKGLAPLVIPAGEAPRSLSFMNLLECHMLQAMRTRYDLRLPKIRRAVALLRDKYGLPHPLVEQPLLTNRVDLLIQDLDELVNVSSHGQLAIPAVFGVHLERIVRDGKSLKFFPFVAGREVDEPKLIVMNPGVGFGKPVIAGTGISTAVIASRFNARESVEELAEEYGLGVEQIEEAVRWETRTVAA